MKHILLVLLFILLSNTATAHSITVHDLYGREVHIPERVDKVLAIGAGSLRLMVYAEAAHLLAGRELMEEKLEKHFRPYSYSVPESYYSLPVVSAGGPGVIPDIEMIKKVDPDVIFITTMTKDQLENLHRVTGKPVVGLNYGEVGHAELENIKDSVRMIGYITHTQKNTQHILNKMAMLRKDIISRTTGLPPKRIFMSAIALKGDKEFTGTERNHPVLKLLNLDNIADECGFGPDSVNYVNMMAEDIASRDPEFIFMDVTGLDSLRKGYSEKYSKLMQIPAAKEGKVYTVMPYNWYNTNIESIFLNAYYVGKIVYPERFADVDIKKTAHEIYSAFLGTDPFTVIKSEVPVYKKMVLDSKGFSFK